MKRRPLVTILVAAAAVSGLRRNADAQSVTVLSNGTGAALQAAINAAADGDTLLLHGGSYSACVIDGKALRIVSEPTNSTTVDSIRVLNLPASKLFTLAGLQLRATTLFPPWIAPPALQFQACAGSVRLDSIDSAGATMGRSGMGATNTTNISIANSIVRGGPGDSNFSAGRGLEVDGQSRLAVYDTVLEGGNGSGAVYQPPWVIQPSAPGGPGLLSQGQGYLSGVVARGGAGGSGSVYFFPSGGGCGGISGQYGEAGIFVASGNMFLRDTAASGGAGGNAPTTCPGVGPGAPGPAISGPTIASSALRLGLRSSPAVREQQLIPITVTGTPGEIVALHIGQRPEFTPDATGSNVRLVADPVRRIVLGVVPPSGVLVSTIKGIALPPAYATATFLMQVVAVEATGALRFGASVPLVVLDSSY